MERISNQADENFLIRKPVAQRLASKMAMRKYLQEGLKHNEREREQETTTKSQLSPPSTPLRC